MDRDERYSTTYGATHQADGSTRFRVWAPNVRRVELHLVEPRDGLLPLQAVRDGNYEAVVENLAPGANYFYRLNGATDRPDPASRYQPLGIHGPSQVIFSAFDWTDVDWPGIAWQDYVIYEAHVGTFTPAGSFAAMIAHLDDLKSLGVTAVQLMPVAQFPGAHNWGYDGVHPYAPQNTYGGPDGLKQLVNACHARGLAVVLDVVYNHLGPEGNYLAEFGPYFTSRHETPWGPAINLDGPDSAAVRRYFVDNALYWFSEFHFDALRLDATHAIHDDSPTHFLAELADTVRELRGHLPRQIYIIAESNRNDPQIVRPRELGGYGTDAQLVDDFHRSLVALAANTRQGSYADFGSLADFAKAYGDGFVLVGQYSKYRGCAWGAEPGNISPNRFVAFASCHDTVGNRPGGRRLSALVDFETWKLAASATLLSYCTPLIFMGDEYDEDAPFHYFTSHLDPQLADAVRSGRQAEFKGYDWRAPFADPQSPDTFFASRLDRSLAAHGRHAIAWRLHQELLQVRRELLRQTSAEQSIPRLEVLDHRCVLVDRRTAHARVILNFGTDPIGLDTALVGQGDWRVRFNSAEPRWSDPVATLESRYCTLLPIVQCPRSCVVLYRDGSS